MFHFGGRLKKKKNAKEQHGCSGFGNGKEPFSDGKRNPFCLLDWGSIKHQVLHINRLVSGPS